MEFGLHFASTTYPERDRSVQFCQEAELAGFSFAIAVEHVVLPTNYASVYPYSPTGKLPGDLMANLPDPLVWMTHVAACTERLHFMTGVLILPQRNPLVLAKQLATMDYLSGGRIELGIGVGWLREEFEAIGVPFERRGQRTDEHIEAMRALWASDDASYHGDFVNFTRMSCNPKPMQDPLPIIIGGHSEYAARRAGRLGNGFFPATGWSGDIKPLLEIVHDEAEKASRDPNLIQVTTGLGPENHLESALRLGEQGIHRVVVPSTLFKDDIPGSLQRFAADVINPAKVRIG